MELLFALPHFNTFVLTNVLQAESKEDNAVVLDASKRTKQALEFLFFPFVTDPKSVLLRHGSVTILHNTHSTIKADKITQDMNKDERHLMLFSYGFLVANIEMQCALRFFVALNDQMMTEKNFLSYLHGKLLLNDGGEDISGKLGVDTLFTLYHCLQQVMYILL